MQKRITIMGVPVDTLTRREVLEQIWDASEGNDQLQIITVNPEMILAAQNDEEFMDILKKNKLNTADGTGILWAANAEHDTAFIKTAKLLELLFKKPTAPIPERVQGADLFIDIARHASDHDARIFLLGADPGIAEKTKHVLEGRFPKIHVVGTHAGSPSRFEEDAIIDMINETSPNILFVAYGAPKQEKWIARNITRLPSVKVAIGVGGTFNYVSGNIPRAPQWMQNYGLEWLHRVIKEPHRIKRIWNAVAIFPVKIISKKSD